MTTFDARGAARRLAPCLVIAVIAAAYVWQTAAFADPSSKEAPVLYASAALALCAVLAIRGLVRSASGREAPPASPAATLIAPPRVSPRRAILMIAIIAGFTGLIYVAGFYIAIAVFLILFLVLVSKLKVAVAALYAAIAPALLWLCLGKLLNLDVYAGLLGGFFK